MALLKFNKNKISQSPLIKIEDIFRVHLNNFKNQKKYYLKYIYKSNFCTFYNRSTYSLYKIYEFTRKKTQKEINIFIPDFICNESLSLLRNTSAKLIFYDHSQINTKKLILKMKNKNANIFLFVNYFGKVTNLSSEFKNFTRKKNILVIEDSTHCIYSYSKNFSDIEIFSPYKQYGIPDGSVIKFKDRTYFNKFNFDSKRNNYLLSIEFLQEYAYLMIYVIKKYIRYLFGYKYEKLNFKNIYFSKKLIGKSINPISLRLLNIYAKRIDFYKSKRIENYYYWKKNLKLILPFINMEDLSYVPYLGLIKFKNNSNREKILKQYSIFGLPIGTWPDLPPEIIKSKLYFKTAREKANNQFTLPVHQNITKSMIDECIKVCFDQYISKFKILYSKKNNIIKVHEEGKLIGKIIILFNPITNQNILKLEFDREFYKTYNFSKMFLYKLSTEFINKLNIKEIIYIRKLFYESNNYQRLKHKGIKDNIIPLSSKNGDIKNFLLSFLGIVESNNDIDISKEYSLNFEIKNKSIKNKIINIFCFKLKTKRIAELHLILKTDHIILENIKIIENYYSLYQYIQFLCVYYKKEKFKFLKIKRKIFPINNFY